MTSKWHERNLFNEYALRLQPEVNIKLRHLYSMLDLLSYVGGLAGIFGQVVQLVSTLLVGPQIEFQMIKRLYYETIPNFLVPHLASIANRYRFTFSKWNTLKIKRIGKKIKRQA